MIGPGPDLAIVGAARSGTSLLASQLSLHPDIDPCSVKEPNFFSRGGGEDVESYDGLFAPREPGLLRLDASASYTYPKFDNALKLLADTSPDVFVVYIVRDPVPRAISHFLFYRHYFRNEKAPTFGEALRASSFYADVSDYERWCEVLDNTFPTERVLVVPFSALTQSSHGVASVICEQLRISPSPNVATKVSAHRNSVVAFRSPMVRKLTSRLRKSRLYPQVRSTLGAHRMRQIRALATEKPELPSSEEVLASCDAGQRAQLAALEDRARRAVDDWLTRQDARTGLNWGAQWRGSA